MEVEDSIKCINCGEDIAGKFCLSCGQPVKPERLTFLSLWSDYFGRVFNLDTKFLRTVRDLTLNPGQVAKDYVLGNRVKHIPPVSYFIVITTLLIIFLSIIDVKFNDMIATTQQAISPADINEKQLKLQQLFSEQFVKNMRTFFFFQIPFVALWGRIIFKKSGYNFLENAVLAFYTHGHLIWLTIAGSLVFKYTGSSFNSLNFILSTIYFCWSCAAFYGDPKPKVYFKGLLVQLLMLLTYMLFIVLVLVAGLIIYLKFIDPEFLKNL